MKLKYNTISSGEGIASLFREFINILEPEVETRYAHYDFTLCLFFCSFRLSEQYYEEEKLKYDAKSKTLEMNALEPIDAYHGLYFLEKRHEFSKKLLTFFDTAFDCPEFKQAHPEFDKEEFMTFLVEFGRNNRIRYDRDFENGQDWGKEYAWFTDEVDYSLDLDK